MSHSKDGGFWQDGNIWHAPSLKPGICTCGEGWDSKQKECYIVQTNVTLENDSPPPGVVLKGKISVPIEQMSPFAQSVIQGAKEALEYAKAAKDDNKKPEMRYFYFPGYLAVHYHDTSESAVELGSRFHSYVLMSLVNNKDTGKLLDGLRDFEQSIFNEHVEGALDRKDLHTSISVVGKLGATKYGFLNYTKGFVWSRLLDAMARHVYAYVSGQTIDPESGLDHRYHVLANIYMLAEHMEYETGENDLINEEESK